MLAAPQGPQSVALLSVAYPVLDINWIVSSAPRAADQETAFSMAIAPRLSASLMAC
jgi:hypothetical protein